MSHTILNQANAFQSGSELWVVFNDSESKWPGLIDWYNNLQFYKLQSHTTPKRSEKLEEINLLTEMNLPTFPPNPNATSLISANRKLPCRWVANLNTNTDPHHSINSLVELLTSLKCQTVRVFLSCNLQQSDFNQSLKKIDLSIDFTWVQGMRNN